MTPQKSNTLALAQRPASVTEQDRLRNMRNAWKAYNGDLENPLKVEVGQPDDNVTLNRCGPIVDKGVSFLFGQAVKIEAVAEAQNVAAIIESLKDEPDEEDDPQPSADGTPPPPAAPKPPKATPKPATPIQDWINGFWGDDDDRMTLLSNAALNGGVCGQAFLKLVPPGPRARYPRLVVLDPTLLRVITSPDDCTVALAYIIEYPAGNDMQKRQVITRIDPDNSTGEYGGDDPNDTWTIYNYVRTTANSVLDAPWVLVGEPLEWPYPFPPIFDGQNLPNPNERWGRPDITPDIIKVNKALNFTESNTARIIKYHAHPKTYAIGTGAKTIDVGVNEMIVFDSPDAKIGNLEMTSDLGSSLNFAATLRSDMDEQSRVPAVALGRLADLPKGNISGVALQLLFQPLIEKTVQKRRLYGQLIRAITRAALVLGDVIAVEEWEDYEIELHWQNLLPVDDLAAAQTALALVEVGVSQDTVIQELGYDPDAEAAKQAARDAKNPKPAPPIPPAPGGKPPVQQVVTADQNQQNDAGMGSH
jgi:hypothetical protein